MQLKLPERELVWSLACPPDHLVAAHSLTQPVNKHLLGTLGTSLGGGAGNKAAGMRTSNQQQPHLLHTQPMPGSTTMALATHPASALCQMLGSLGPMSARLLHGLTKGILYHCTDEYTGLQFYAMLDTSLSL